LIYLNIKWEIITTTNLYYIITPPTATAAPIATSAATGFFKVSAEEAALVG
jgi:hypothetical protein